VNEVATVLDRAVPIRDTAIEFLITCVSESSVPTACRERIATALKPQLGHPGGQNEYHVAYLLGTLAKADTTLRRDLLQMADQSQVGVRRDALHAVRNISEVDNDCFRVMIRGSYDRSLTVKATAISNLGRMRRARDRVTGRLPDRHDAEAVEMIRIALDSRSNLVQHAAVTSVRALGLLCTPAIVSAFMTKLHHEVDAIKNDVLRGFAFDLSHLGRGAMTHLQQLMENEAELPENRALAVLGLVSAGYGESRARRTNMYSAAAVRGLIKAATMAYDRKDDHRITENSLVGLKLMVPRTLLPHRAFLRSQAARYNAVSSSYEYEQEKFVELLDQVLLWEQQMCAWVVASHSMPVMDVRLAIMTAYMDMDT